MRMCVALCAGIVVAIMAMAMCAAEVPAGSQPASKPSQHLAGAPKLLQDMWQECLAFDKDLFSQCNVEYSRENKAMTIRYKVRNYEVYPLYRNGEYGDHLETVEAPQASGIMVTVLIREGSHTSGPRLYPVDAQRPYWKEYVNAYDSREKRNNVLVSIDYGRRKEKMVLPLERKLAALVKGFSDKAISEE